MMVKNRTIYILKYLWDHTDEENPATTNEIIEHLSSFGIVTTRKTVTEDISELQNSGIDIVCNRSRQNEYFIGTAIMRAIQKTAKQNADVLKTLKLHIGMGLEAETTEDKSLDIQIRIAEIDTEFKQMLKAVSAENADTFDEEKIGALMNEKQRLTQQLEQYANARQKRESAKSRLDQIFTILDGMQNHPMEYDDEIVRQILECVVVESKDEIKVVFVGGLEVCEQLVA